MSLLNHMKDSKRSFSAQKFERSEDARQSNSNSNVKQQSRNMSRFKQDEYSMTQENSNSRERDSIFTKNRKSESKFNHRGRIFLPFKKDEYKTLEKSQLNLSNSQTSSYPIPQNRLTQQSLKDSVDLFWNMDINTPEAQVNSDKKLMERENQDQSLPTKSKFQNQSIEGSQTTTLYERHQLSNNIPKDIAFDKQVLHSNDSVDIVRSNNISSSNTIKSPTLFLSAQEQKQQQPSQCAMSRAIQSSSISTIQPTPQISTIGLKSKKLRPQKQGKKLNKQNTLLLEDKLSDVELDDENGITNKDLMKSLTSNQIQLLMSPQLVNNQGLEQIIEGKDANQYLEQNVLSLDKDQSNPHGTMNDNQIIYASLTALDQQKTLQTEGDEVDIHGQNQSGLFVLDNCNDDQLGMGSGVIQQNSSITNMLQISKEKSTNSKDALQDLQEVMEDDLSTSNQGDYDSQRLSKQMIDYNQPNTSNQYNNEPQKHNDGSGLLIAAKQSPIKKGLEQNQPEFGNSQQYFESVKNSDMFQCSPTHLVENTENIKSNRQINLPQSLSHQDFIHNHAAESEKSNQKTFQTEKQTSVQNTNCLNQEEFASVGEQQDIVTEPDKHFSPREKFLQSQSNSAANILPASQKGNLSLANLINDSNFYGSESTNEPNSVKKRNLTSSQLSNNFGKYNKSNHDQKAHMSSQESNNNSQETVKLQSNSKNFMEFTQFSNKRYPNDEEYEEPEQIQYKPFFALPLPSPNIYSNEATDLRASSDFFNQQQLMQENENKINKFGNGQQQQYKQNNKLQLQEQTERNSCDKFQSYRDGDQNTVLYANQDDRDYYDNSKLRKSSLSQSKSKIHRKHNSNIRFSYNNRNSPTYLEQSTYIVDETIKSTTTQNILHQKNNRFNLNYDEQDDQDKIHGQIPHIPQHLHHHQSQQENRNYISNGSITEKENMRNFENHQEGAYYKQSPILKNQNTKDPNSNKQQTLPSPHSPNNNILFTDPNLKAAMKNGNEQSQSIQADQIKITLSSNLEKNHPNKLVLGDNSPSINQSCNDYLSFWMNFKKLDDDSRQFTCKEFCQMIWPQTLDRKQRQDKELVMKLHDTKYCNEITSHKNMYDAASIYLYRFTHNTHYNSVDDQEYKSKRNIKRSQTVNNPTKLLKTAEETKKPQAQIELSNNLLDLTIFNLLHILAFLNLYKDNIDTNSRKLLKKINLFLLLIRISNAVVQKFKQNAFDKCIKLLSKDVFEFLNDMFYSVFSETIQIFNNLEKVESNYITVKIFDKIDAIILSLTTTEEIMKFIHKNPNSLQRTVQTIVNIIH